MSQVLKPKKGYKKVKGLFGETIDIPEEWNYVILDNLTPKNEKSSIRMGPFGSSLKTHELLDSGKIKTLWIENIVNNKFTWEYQKFISKEKYQELKGFTVKSDDILITMMGTLGRVAIVPDDIGTAIISSHLLKITLEQQKAMSLFLFYFLKSNFILRQIIRETRGIVMGGLNTRIIKNLLIKTPHISEQQKIVSILFNVDELINSTQKIIDQTKSLKKGLMQKLLTKGIDHTKFKKVNFGRHFISYEIPEEWELSRLGNHSTVHGRIGWKNLRSDEYLESGFPMLSVWSLVETSPYGIDFTKGIKRLSQFRYDESPEIQLQNNDILIAKDGDIGRIGFIKNLPEPATVNSHVVPVRVIDELINPEFLYWFFKSKPFQTYCKSFTSGTTIPLFTQKDLRNCIIPIPKKEEQNKIVTILSNIDSRIISQIQYKEKLERLKKSLMQKLLTGQVRVIV